MISCVVVLDAHVSCLGCLVLDTFASSGSGPLPDLGVQAGSLQGVVQQAGDGHGPHPAWHWRDGGRHLRHLHSPSLPRTRSFSTASAEAWLIISKSRGRSKTVEDGLNWIRGNMKEMKSKPDCKPHRRQACSSYPLPHPSR